MLSILFHVTFLRSLQLRTEVLCLSHAPFQAYVGESQDTESDAYLSPWLATDDQLRNLPPIYMVAATFDPLLDDAVRSACLYMKSPFVLFMEEFGEPQRVMYGFLRNKRVCPMICPRRRWTLRGG
jgi:hypothetical protein